MTACRSGGPGARFATAHAGGVGGHLADRRTVDLVGRCHPTAPTASGLPAAFYGANWRFVLAGDSYGTDFDSVDARSGGLRGEPGGPPIEIGRIDGRSPESSYPESDPARMERFRQIIDEVAAGDDCVRPLRLDRWLDARPVDSRLRPDGVHFTESSTLQVSTWLGPPLHRPDRRDPIDSAPGLRCQSLVDSALTISPSAAYGRPTRPSRRSMPRTALAPVASSLVRPDKVRVSFTCGT